MDDAIGEHAAGRGSINEPVAVIGGAVDFREYTARKRLCNFLMRRSVQVITAYPDRVHECWNFLRSPQSAFKGCRGFR